MMIKIQTYTENLLFLYPFIMYWLKGEERVKVRKSCNETCIKKREALSEFTQKCNEPSLSPSPSAE